MKRHLLRLTVAPLILLLGCATAPDSETNPRGQAKLEGVLLAIDLDRHTVEVEAGKERERFTFEWDKRTRFLKDGQDAAPESLKPGTNVTIDYKRVSPRRPLLKQVTWK